MSEFEQYPPMDTTRFEIDEETPEIEGEEFGSSEDESAQRREVLNSAMVEDRARSEEEAVRLAAGLKKKEEPAKVRVVERPPSQQGKFWGGLAKLGVSWPFGRGVEKAAKGVAMWWDDFFSSIEKAGTDEIKKYWKAANPTQLELTILSPLVGLGVFLAGKIGMSKPEKSLREKVAEEEKKKKADAGKRKVDKAEGEGGKEEGKEEPSKVEESSEEKKAA
ncbi:hypothetical protein HY771_01820 [Candidatus Uhrbacteria bacterium]|nr:hypothetical protein [Candidatus Uhrbacteria bacterium]